MEKLSTEVRFEVFFTAGGISLVKASFVIDEFKWTTMFCGFNFAFRLAIAYITEENFSKQEAVKMLSDLSTSSCIPT